MIKKILLIVVLAMLTLNLVSALDVKTYSVAFNLVDSKAVVEVDLVFNNKTTDMFEFELPEDYTGLSVYVEDNAVTPVVVDNMLMVELNDNSKLSFSYITREFTDKTNFLMNMALDFDVDNLVIKLVLPEGASLKRPIKGELSSGSIYPRPDKATTDGRSLLFYWLQKDMKQGDDVSIFAQVEPKEKNLGLRLVLIAVVLISVGTLYVSSKRKPKKEIVEKVVEKVVEKEADFSKHLKDDEEQVINVLKMKEGSCEQATLRIATGMSKASLSRLLMELEARKIIHKEKKGKKNVIFLRK